MKTAINSLWKRLTVLVLGVLGFSSCEEILDIGGGLDMYGQPTAEFKAIGTVKDEAGNGIEGIRVAVTQHWHMENTENVIYDQNDWNQYDTLYTDEKGAYLLETRDNTSGPDDVSIVFEDIDGEENGGEFQAETVTPEVKQTQEASGWNRGTFEVQADAVLKKK